MTQESMSDRFRRWFTYEMNANKKVLDSLATVPPERSQEDQSREALDLFGHMIAARWFWLYRFGFAPKPANLFPEDIDIAGLRSQAQAMYVAWLDFFESLTDDVLMEEFEYRSTEGERYSKEDILKQLSDHHRYHCGQIASRVKTMGGTAASTDYVFHVRKLVL